MRITNKMMSNNSMSNINTNKEYLDHLNNQMATEKKITRPSDDPIIAIRALRLRSNLSEIGQYYGSNVPDAQAWVMVTQSAIESTKGMISSMKALCDQGANGTNTVSERQNIYQELQGLQKQIYANGNATDAGRTVFTGYRTGESLTFKEDTEADYRGITDSFNASDVTRNTYVEGAPTLDEINAVNPTGDETTVQEDKVNRIRLSYDNINRAVKKTPHYVDGDELGTISGWNGSEDWSKYVEGGRLTTNGQGLAFEVEKNGSKLATTVAIDPKCNKSLKWSDDPSIGPLSENAPHNPQREAIAPAEITVKGTSDEMKVTYGSLTYNVTKDGAAYKADKGATVTDNGDGTITLKVPESSSEIYTEIKINPSGPAVLSADKCRNIDQLGLDIETGKIYATTFDDETTLIYRNALEKAAAIPTDSITNDPVDGLQSFTINYDGIDYKIEKQSNGEFKAVNGSGAVIETIEVTQNNDKSFKIVTDAREKESNVFNVSANGRMITSYYHETKLDVKITTSDAAVKTDSTGKDLTAYQYLALGADNKNADDEAKDSIYLLADTGELVFGSNVAETLSSLKDIPGVDTISVIYDKSSFESGELRPEHYFDSEQIDDNHISIYPINYDDHNQDINYTVGTNQSIKINTNAEDVFDTQIIREIDDLLTAISEYNSEEEKVNRLKAMQEDESSYDETQKAQIQKMLDAANKSLDIAKNKLQRTYEEAITQFGKFFEQANLAETECGTVENRLELISNRLSEEKTTVTTLASDNENVDLTNIAVEVSEANLVYNAALMATGRISQQTLVDYI